MALIPQTKKDDWESVRRAIQKLAFSKLGPTSKPTFAGLTLTDTCLIAGGANFLRVTGLQTNGIAMAGTLRGAYIDVSNGNTAATGTIRGMELKARTEAPGDIGNNVNVLEGLSISVDSKGHSVTTMRVAEFILDGSTGGEITEAVGLRIANNLQANKAIASYGLQIYRDSFDYTYDIVLSLGGHITGDSYVDQDLRIAAIPTFAGLHINSVEAVSTILLTLESNINNNNEYNEILFKIAGGVNYGAIRSYVGASAGDSYMSLLTTTDGGTLVQQVTVQHDGKVGFGKPLPSQKLDIVAGNSGVLISDTGEGRGVAKSLFFGDGGGTWTPIIWGVAGADDDAGLHLLAETKIADDSGTEPLIRLNARQIDSTPITTRPILAIENDRNQLVTVDKDGNVDITGAVTGASFITAGNIGVVADTDLLQLAANTLTVNGTITLPLANKINFRDSDIFIGSAFDGKLDISADISVGFFYDNADVGNENDGQSVYINRMAAEGDDYLQFYIDSDRYAIINANQTLKIQRQGNTLLLLAANALTVNGTLTLSTIAAEGTDVDKFLVNSTGVIKYRTGAQVLSDIGGQASGNYITALTGEVTASGPGSVAATIANDAVTYAKMQNVSATDKILGRVTAGAGNVEEIACTAAGRAILDDVNAGVQRTTLGLAIGTDVQAYDAELTSLAALSYVAASFVKMTGANTFALRTIGETADDLEGTIDHDNLANGGAHDYAYISGNDGATGITAAELEELSDGSETALHSHAGAADSEKVKIDAAATADYIGAANNDGVLRTGVSLSYTDGGDFVTLNTIQDIRTSASPTFAGIIIANGGAIGQAAGPLLTFDDTNDFLEITGCNVCIGGTVPISTLHGLDIFSGGLSLIIGADNLGSVRTNEVQKDGRFGICHYTNAEQPLGILLATSAAGASTVSFGGGSGLVNAATSLKFWTAANTTTTTGTARMTIDSAGNVGINDTVPAEKLDVGGNVRADDYLEYSPLFVGDAISAIKNIKAKKEVEGDWAEVDHSTLPEGVRTISIKKGKEIKCRSIGKSVQLNLKAIKEIIERMDKYDNAEN